MTFSLRPGRMTLAVVLPLLLLCLLGTCGRAQTIYYVETTGVDDPARDGLTPATAWASLNYACGRAYAGPPAGPGPYVHDTIQLGAGVFTVDTTAIIPPRFTIQGIDSVQTILRTGQQWTMRNRPREPRWEDYVISYHRFGVPGYRNDPSEGFGIRNLRIESTLTNLTHGAIMLRDAKDVLIENVRIEDFGWSGINLTAVERTEIRHCHFENANRTEDNRFGANIYGNVVRDSRIHHNDFRNTVPGSRQWGVGIKGGFFRNTDIDHNDFTTGTGFDIEIPFEQERGLRIHDNVFNRTVSVPKGGPNGDPRPFGFDYSIWIYDNYFTNGYDIEGPRGYMEVSGNFFDVRNDNGRCIATFGGDITEPQRIHHNVAVGIDRSFMWANAQQDSVEFYNNTLFYEFADNRAAAMIDIRSSALGWKIKNNLLVSPASQPRRTSFALTQNDVDFTHNLVINATELTLPAGNFRDIDPGLNESGARPDVFFAPADAGSFVVDRGVDVGFPFEGAAPDIGAFEFAGFGALPIELLRFGGRAEAKTAVLTWETGRAADFSHFELTELSADGREIGARTRVQWEEAPQPPEGEHQTWSHTLPWTDATPERHFRLHLVDLDGSREISDVVTLRRTTRGEGLTVYPNPVVDEVRFASPEWAAYRVYDAGGRTVLRGSCGAGTTRVDVRELPAGTYRLVRIDRRGEIRAATFVR